jgi:2,3-bisphosphoglycerate-independent phosphoglycerate mutase
MKCALIILDGYGVAKSDKGNGVALAKKPNLDAYMQKYANTVLNASGLAVGLPEGQMGNSEVGHLNIGAGRVVFQDITAIDNSIKSGLICTNFALKNTVLGVKSVQKTVHLMGLLSDGGVHSHINHMVALLEFCKKEGVKNVCVHAITDGRDTLPKSAMEYIDTAEKQCKKCDAKIATIGGRYYAMDRDNRTERVQAGFDTIINAKGQNFKSAHDAVKDAYANGITDEFIVPATIGDFDGVHDGDAIIFFNFRADRARQITQKIVTEKPNVKFVCMTQYDAAFANLPTIFPPKNITNTLGEVISQNNMTQVRLAETEKYAHVTFFFNGGVEKPNNGEMRILVPSPKVATYDLQPEMSAAEVTQRAMEQITGTNPPNVLIMNYANCDMVGHTGKIDATIKAVETVDACVGKVVNAVLNRGGVAIITADHGNAEQMLDRDGKTPFTAHSVNPVPLIICGAGFEITDTKKGIIKFQKGEIHAGALCDIAPTILKIIGLQQPAEMTGKALF